MIDIRIKAGLQHHTHETDSCYVTNQHLPLIAAQTTLACFCRKPILASHTREPTMETRATVFYPRNRQAGTNLKSAPVSFRPSLMSDRTRGTGSHMGRAWERLCTGLSKSTSKSPITQQQTLTITERSLGLAGPPSKPQLLHPLSLAVRMYRARPTQSNSGPLHKATTASVSDLPLQLIPSISPTTI
jgi:hypothetical protein